MYCCLILEAIASQTETIALRNVNCSHSSQWGGVLTLKPNCDHFKANLLTISLLLPHQKLQSNELTRPLYLYALL